MCGGGRHDSHARGRYNVCKMTYYGPQDIARSFATVRANTITIAEEIPEEKFDFQATPDSRSIRAQLIHILHAPAFQYHIHSTGRADLHGFNFMEFMAPLHADEAKPYSKAEIIAKLKADGEKLEQWIAGLEQAFLAETVTFPPHLHPPTKSRFEMIISIKEHEMHHRGQLMAWQRMIGITPHTTRRREEIIQRMREQTAEVGNG